MLNQILTFVVSAAIGAAGMQLFLRWRNRD